jgi:putative N6-adenine-specific DNA methylase
MNLTATTTFGIEKILKNELKDLGYNDLKVLDGRIYFDGEEKDAARCCLNLRTADRIFIKLKEFKAESFEELFQGVKDYSFGDLICEDGQIIVNAKSKKSKLFSISDIQSISKKAIIESLKRKYKVDWFKETGPSFRFEVNLNNDMAEINLDIAGEALHKRGYREKAGQAPLKETLAAALVLLSGYNGDRAFSDPFCGSGTIPIEAAMIAKNIPPTLHRSFLAETNGFINKDIWEAERELGVSRINDKDIKILASDIDANILKTARENAAIAKVDNYISFQKLDFKDFSSRKKYGIMVSNPPYGERIGEKAEVQEMYKDLGKLYKNLPEWSFYILTSNLIFEKLFGKKADKNRKLYNGSMLCYLYQYINNPKE